MDRGIIAWCPGVGVTDGLPMRDDAADSGITGATDRGTIAWSPGAGVTDGSPMRDDTADSGIMGITGITAKGDVVKAH
jgi:hypothetical protein